MAESVLIVNGASRINGNTDILVGRIIEGAKGVGLNPTLVELRSKHISNCIGCYSCRDESKCSFQDNMTEIRNFINKSELLIFACPLYWCGVTGLMKTFLDRLFFYYHPKNKALIAGKKAIIVTPMNQKNVDFESKVLVEFYNRLFGCLGVKIIKRGMHLTLVHTISCGSQNHSTSTYCGYKNQVHSPNNQYAFL